MRKTMMSFEIFPPKRNDAVDTIYQTLDALKDLSPDFISVTYGAGGSDNCKATFEIAENIKQRYGIESVAHLPCIGLDKKDVNNLLERLREANINNILALRGDLPAETVKTGDFAHASDLISYIKEWGDFHILAACYPEGHLESRSLVEDIQNLKKKVDAGAGQLVSQLFFDNECFYRFQERCELAGIHVPIEAGIMPVTGKKQIERMVSLCGASLPPKFRAILDRYGDSPEALRDAGIAYAIDQIVDLICHGVDGIHLYTMNQPDTARRIYDAVYRLLEV